MDSVAPPIDIRPHDWREVRRVLEACVPDYEVWAFGSRVNGDAKPYSDLDLVVVSEDPLPIATLAELRHLLDDSDLTIKVDIVDWASTAPSFKKIIDQEKTVVQQPRKVSV